jgi:ATP-dependent Clp protease ATP-binding subunit ClpA
MAKPRDPETVMDQWTERDLSVAAARGELPHAYCVDDLVERVSAIVSAGRHPILAGHSGVGKTAILYELAHRAARSEGPLALSGKRILQLSIHRRIAGLKRPGEIRPEMEKLVDALCSKADQIVPFFQDIDLAYAYDLEPLFQSLAIRFCGPVLAEGERGTVDSLFEDSPELGESFTALNVEEPDMDRMHHILGAWSADQAGRHGRRFTTEALDEALYLTHRFLVRNRHPRKTLDLLQQAGRVGRGGEAVRPADVIDHFSRQYRVPRLLVDPSVSVDLDDVERRFRQEVLGQGEAIDTVVDMISLIKARLADERRAFGVLLFVGPTGVGKTHVAQLLAEFLFGSRDRLIRVNMADYQSPVAAELLFGDPDEHRPQQAQGILTQRVVGQPCAVLLLDEFEKAHSLVHDRFLQLADEGCFINGRGETISCRSMVIIATSNAGSEISRGNSVGFANFTDPEALDREINRRLEQEFRVELLNRFDRIVHFHSLTRQDIRTIARRELERLEHRVGLKQRRLNLETDHEVLDWLCSRGYDRHYGARFLRRTIERNVSTVLAQQIVRSNPEPGTTLRLVVREDGLGLGVVERASAVSKWAEATVPLHVTVDACRAPIHSARSDTTWLFSGSCKRS